MKHRLAAGILVRDGKVLLCHCSPEREWKSNVWDFPGGRIQPGESAEEALARELWEGLSISAHVHGDGPGFSASQGNRELAAWVIRAWEGTPSNAAPEEYDDVRWLTLEEAGALTLADESYRDWIAQVLAD